MIKKHWKPILSFIVLATLLTELITTNVSLGTFIMQPWLFLLFMTLGYGFPALVIREISLRKNLGLLGLFFLGLIYGFYNEGLIARTIFNPFHAPIDTFATYGLISDIRIPWTLTINFWHALHAIIYPLIFIYFLFPGHKDESWMGNKLVWFLGIFCFLFGSVVFFIASKEQPAGRLDHYIFMVVSSMVLWWLSGKFSMPKFSAETMIFSWKKIRIGIWIYLLLVFVPFIFAGASLPSLFFVIYFVVVAVWLIRKLLKFEIVSLGDLVLAGIGSEISNSFFVFVAAVTTANVDRFTSSTMFLIVFSIIIIKLKKKYKSPQIVEEDLLVKPQIQ